MFYKYLVVSSVDQRSFAQFLPSKLIGQLLVEEQSYNDDARVVHCTVGRPQKLSAPFWLGQLSRNGVLTRGLKFQCDDNA